MAGAQPKRPTVIEAAAAPRRSASGQSVPACAAASSVPRKASPAPTGLSAVTGKAGVSIVSPAVPPGAPAPGGRKAVDPSGPRLNTTMRSRAAIASRTAVPLVLHGASGIAARDRLALADTPVAKMNVGTELRQAFGEALRATLADHPERFDRVAILRDTIAPVREAARAVIRSMHAAG